MAKSKTVDICGKKVEFRSSASIPRMYRIMFKRDIFKDLERLASAAKEVEDDGEDGFEIEDLELFENVAYCMAKHADPQIKSIDDWLDGFDMFSIYEILPEILELWGENVFTTSEAKKNQGRHPGN